MKESIAEPEAENAVVSCLISGSGIPDRRSCLRSTRGFNFFSVNGLRGPISEYEIVPSGYSTIFTVVMVMPLSRLTWLRMQSLNHFGTHRKR
jgi:hypothetical protein